MTINNYILPMSKSERIIFITYPDAQILDFTGPAAVFSLAARLGAKPNYECVIASEKGGLVAHSSGISVDSIPLRCLKFRASDSFFVVGGGLKPIEKAVKSAYLLKTLQKAAKITKRYGSICSGTFVLGAAGLLDGKRVTTHWFASRELQTRFANARVDGDALYVQDKKMWTSAGVTTGIDMALAIVAADCGNILKAKVAKRLVVYSHRPGNQAQFSQLLEAQTRSEAHFDGLFEWLVKRLKQPPRVEEMAEFVGMSTRSFHRKFSDSFEMPPGKFVERVRLDHGRELLEAGELSKSVAYKIGFKSDAAFRCAFKAVYGVTPSHYGAMQLG
ncbi:MAG: transcriptional regulator GlxA family with amidase domain [Pseudohongiellaceae bacterium]|jgi:transcriptional regulator GlxA family with amidase domain